MIQWTDEQNKQFRGLLFFSVIIYIVCPIIYLIVANVIDKGQIRAGGEFDMMLYILLILAVVQPIVYPFIEKYQISIYKKNPDKVSSMSGAQNLNVPFAKPVQPGSPMALFFTLSVIKAALVEACFIYGLVVFFLSGDISNVYYFYPIGITWTLIYFPRKAHVEKFMEKVERYEPKY